VTSSAKRVPHKSTRGLRWQLTLSYLLLVGLTVLVLGPVTLWLTHRSFAAFVGESSRRSGLLLSHFLAAHYQRQGERWTRVQVQAVVERLNSLPQGEMKGLLQENLPPAGPLHKRGQIVTSLRRLPLEPPDRVLVAGPDGRVLADTERRDLGRMLPKGILSRGAPIMVEGRQVGTVVMGAQMGLPTALQRYYLGYLNWVLPLAMVLVGGVALLVGTVVARRITDPVRRLATAATRLAAEGAVDLAEGSYQPLPVHSSDELGEMSAAFNAMVSQLQEQSRLRRQMVADIAHELRTPLSVIRLELEALEDGLQSPTEATSSLRGEIDLLTQLVKDLGLLARHDAGEQRVDLALTDLAGPVRETVARWETRASANGVALKTEIAPGLPQMWMDPLRITRVLTNLLDNALRHTPEGGQIVIALEAERSRHLREEPSALRVTVADTGQGIPPDQLENVFRRFYRLDPARSRASGGRGLGLAIAKQIVELHGGRIWTESTGIPGEGTRVIFTLPLGPKPDA